MKILFWILAILSIPVGFFISFVSYVARGIGLVWGWIGEVACLAGMFAGAVSIVCAVLGIIKLRRGSVKKAVAFALAGVAFSGIVLGGMFLDEVVFSKVMEKGIADRKEEMYGENWDSAPAIEGIPEQYEVLLNEFYAIAKGQIGDTLMDFGLVSMPDYYGDAPLDNIGFAMMDVNADGVEELLVGTTAPVEEGGTAIFCIYSDPENPFYSVCSVEGEVYYLHAGETDGSYLAEIGGRDAAWQLSAIEGEYMVDIIYQEGAMDPAGRLTLEMIPFSQFK